MKAHLFLTKIDKVNLIAMIIKVLLRFYILILIFFIDLTCCSISQFITPFRKYTGLDTFSGFRLCDCC